MLREVRARECASAMGLLLLLLLLLLLFYYYIIKLEGFDLLREVRARECAASGAVWYAWVSARGEGQHRSGCFVWLYERMDVLLPSRRRLSYFIILYCFI